MAEHLTEAVIAKTVREVISAAQAAREAKTAGEPATPTTGRSLADPGHRGLWLRIGKTGTKTWALRARGSAYAGKPNWFSLGQHPGMGLAEARRAADRMLIAVRDGANPIAERKAARQRMAVPAEEPAPPIDTLAAVLDIYEVQQGRHLKSWAHSRLRINRVFRPFLARSVREIAPTELQVAADSYPARPSARLAVSTLKPALKWAARRRLVPSVLLDLERPGSAVRRQRVLSCEELAGLLPALRASPRPGAAAMRFMLLTLCRREEAAGATWREIDLAGGTWSIPAERTKNRQPHVVPLPRQAIELLRARLPTTPDDPAGLLFATSKGTALRHWDFETKALQAASGTTGWHRHDLRRTGATMLGEMGELPDIIEAALNHTSIRSVVAATYNRSRYRPQVALALQRLADALDGIETGTGAEIVPLARSA